ncbi:zinc finger A20 and AN1 domain-containing stress-associated protein 8-like protein [Tanacetum coccineum]
MESTKETWCQAGPEGPIFCINNCGFWESAATMNMCSICHMEMISKQEIAKLAASSFDDIINGGLGSDAMPSRPNRQRRWNASLVPRGLVKPASTVSVANFSALLTATLSNTALLLITKLLGAMP